MTAILFDVDDTLYDQLEPFRLACGQVLGTDFRADYERLFVRSRYYSELVFNQSESGRMAMEDMYVYRLVHAFADLGLHLDPGTRSGSSTHTGRTRKGLNFSPAWRESCQRLRQKAPFWGF